MPDDLKDSILSIFEASLEAQLRAVRRLRSSHPSPPPHGAARSVPSRHGIRHTQEGPHPLACLRTPGAHPLRLPRRRRSRKPGLFPNQKDRPRRSLPPHRQEHVRFTPGGPMTLFAAWSEIVADWAPVSPSRAPSIAPPAKPWAPWSAWAGAVCRASSGPTAASSATGRASTSSTRVVVGNPRPCSRLCSAAPWPTVPAA